MAISKKSLPGRGNKHQGPEVGSRLLWSKNSMEARVAGLEGDRKSSGGWGRSGNGAQTTQGLVGSYEDFSFVSE